MDSAGWCTLIIEVGLSLDDRRGPEFGTEPMTDYSVAESNNVGYRDEGLSMEYSRRTSDVFWSTMMLL